METDEDFIGVSPINQEPPWKFRVSGKKANGETVILYQGDSDDGQWFVFSAALRGKKYLSVWMTFNHSQES